jgi:predicted ABC-class ATPase
MNKKTESASSLGCTSPFDDLLEKMKKTIEQRIEGDHKIKEWEEYKKKLDEYHREQSKKYLKKEIKSKGMCYCSICLLDLI